MRVVGIMSGTSLDGIDVAVVDIRGRGFRASVETVAVATYPYSAKIRRSLMAVSNAECHTRDIARLDFALPELYAKAVRDCCAANGLDLASIELVGCHGQTIYHEDGVCTMQIGNGCVLAERLGKPVVSDFRPRDMAAGGKGAPLAPYFDFLWFRHAKRGRVLLNLGGIGNLTAIPAGAGPEQVVAFDTGPGNMVIDQLVAWHTGGRSGFDRGGRLASRGQVHRALLAELMKDRWFRRPPPKTAGREQYGQEFIDRLTSSGVAAVDLIATATAFTAATVADQVRRFVRFPVDDLIVAGGGARNPVLMAHLMALLPEAAVSTATSHGLDGDAKEAIFFAVLAYETWHGRPSSIPAATGARHAGVLGKLSR